MRFGKGTGELKAKDDKDSDITMSDADKKKIGTLLENTKWDNTDKFGEGDFALRLTVEDEDVKVELVDKSNFNGGKEYVMDSQTIKGGAQANVAGNGEQKVTLAGQEIKFTDLKDNFVDAIQNNVGNANGNKKIKTLDIKINKSGKEMKFGKGTGELKATDGDGKNIDMTQAPNQADKQKIEKLLAGTDWSTAPKLGEGDFALRLTVDKEDIKVELVDKSNFNGGKEYVMDSQTIKEGATNSNTATVTLAGQEIKFTNLADKFVDITNPAGGKNIKTLDINIKESGKEIELKNEAVIKGKDEDGKEFDITQNQPQAGDITKIGELLEKTDWSTAPKLGEGDFALRLTVEDVTGGKKDVKVELVDKSNFNGGKEYVMDSQTIKDVANGNGNDPKTVTLAGQEIKFTNLKGNFVDL